MFLSGNLILLPSPTLNQLWSGELKVFGILREGTFVFGVRQCRYTGADY